GQNEAVLDELKGILNTILHPIDSVEGAVYALSHIDETFAAVEQAISDSWNQDVVNGDWNSRAKWVGNVEMQVKLAIAELFVGTKGVDKISKLGKTSKLSESVYFIQGTKNVITLDKFKQSVDMLNNILMPKNQFAYAVGNNIRSRFDTPDFHQAEEKLSTYQFAKDEAGSSRNNPVNESHTPSLSTSEIISSLQETENFRPKSLKHILEGEINWRGEAMGYHSEFLENTHGRIIPGTDRRINDYGAYKAQVEVDGVPKAANGGYSTFFPKDWHPQQIVDNINEAYSNKIHMGGNTNIYDGVGIDGLPIRLFLDGNGKIISAFPRQGR
ncbi:EndoU domain-containing protein, partial [Bacillus mycoides]